LGLGRRATLGGYPEAGVGFVAAHAGYAEHAAQALAAVAGGQLFERLQGAGFIMSYTMEDFKRDLAKEYFKELTLQELREVLRSLSPAKRRKLLESWPAEEIQQHLDQTAGQAAPSRKPRRKK
jgi:hypothetical protein